MTDPNSKIRRALRVAMTIAAVALIGWAVYGQLNGAGKDEPTDYLKVAQQLQRQPKAVKGLHIVRGATVRLDFKADGRKDITADYPDERTLRVLVQRAEQQNVPVFVADVSRSVLKEIFIQLIPMILFMALFILVMVKYSGMGKMFGGKRFEAGGQHSDTTFDDVAGIGEARGEVIEIVEFLKDHERFTKVGARVPRGVLFVGPPGTGKTLLAKAVAGESDAAFFSLTGSDFVEMFAGLGANRVRKLFENARAAAPSIIFIDEIDAIGRSRSGSSMGGGNDEREQTLNQMLSEMDGFAAGEAVVVIAATNRPDVLDPALMRPGRFDRQITVEPPDMHGRLEILHVHAAGKPIDESQLESLARNTPGFTGAQLANLLNEAAILAARRDQDQIDFACLNDAMLRVVAGLESRRILSEEEKSRIAYHEVGHALCAHFTEHRTPVQKISVISRGHALGFTLSIPDQERLLETRASLMDRLVMLLGGRAAELVIFGSASSGAANDLERATSLATQMVTRMGLSDVIGPRVVSVADDSYVGQHAGQLTCSPETARQVEAEVLAIITEAQQAAVKLVGERQAQLERVTVALAEQETIEADEFLDLLGPAA